MAPVRARIPSSNVVLPLWNGPTSAMHRGPVARVPFCAMSASHAFRDAAFCETVWPDNYRFRLQGGLARGGNVPGRCCGTAKTRVGKPTLPHVGLPQLKRAEPSARRPQGQIAETDGDIETDLTRYRERLQ